MQPLIVGIRAGEDSQLVRELMDPGAILIGGLGTADQKTMSLTRVLGPAVREGRSLYPKGQRRTMASPQAVAAFAGARLLERSRDGHGVCVSGIEWLG